MASILGLLRLTLRVPEAVSLKDKRRAVKGFKDRVRQRFNVSVAEVEALDRMRLAELAVAMVGNDRQYVEGRLQQIVNQAATHRDMILTEQSIEWL